MENKMDILEFVLTLNKIRIVADAIHKLPLKRFLLAVEQTRGNAPKHGLSQAQVDHVYNVAKKMREVDEALLSLAKHAEETRKLQRKSTFRGISVN